MEIVYTGLDPFESIIQTLPPSVAHELRQTQEQIRPFYVSQDHRCVLLCSIIDDIYDFTGVKADEQGNMLVAIEWGNTPESIFDKRGMTSTYQYRVTYDADGTQLGQEFTVNGRVENASVSVCELLENLRSSMNLRINPPFIFD